MSVRDKIQNLKTRQPNKFGLMMGYKHQGPKFKVTIGGRTSSVVDGVFVVTGEKKSDAKIVMGSLTSCVAKHHAKLIKYYGSEQELTRRIVKHRKRVEHTRAGVPKITWGVYGAAPASQPE